MWTLRAAKGQQDERGNGRALAAVHAGPTCSLHFPSRALRALRGATGAVQHGAMQQTGSDFCPKASVSHRLGCQLGTMSRRQSRCAVTKRNRYHFKHTALQRGGRGRQENPIMHFYGGERGTGGLTLLWPHERRHKYRILQVFQPMYYQTGRAGGYSRKDLILLASIYFWLEKKHLESIS